MPVLSADDPILRLKSKKVRHLDSTLQKLIDDMVETMHSAKGLGLAAPQVGTPLRIIVLELPKESDDPLAGRLIVLCNPEIVKASGEWEPEEGCLCLPGYVANVKRARSVVVRGRDRQGKEVKIKAKDTLAQALQHEIDHLNGTLFFDHLQSLNQLRRVEPKDKGKTTLE